MKTGIELISEKRANHEAKGYSLEHDLQHCHGELAKVAAVLAVLHTDAKVTDPDGWDSDSDVWGLPGELKSDPIECLAVAGSLIAGEIDRLQAKNK
jgi:hypothetical protein